MSADTGVKIYSYHLSFDALALNVANHDEKIRQQTIEFEKRMIEKIAEHDIGIAVLQHILQIQMR